MSAGLFDSVASRRPAVGYRGFFRSVVAYCAGAMGDTRAAVLPTAVVSGAITVASVLVPQLQVGYRRSALHVALETAASLIALLAGFLVFGRLQRRSRLNELALACALAVLALSNLFFVTIPTLAGQVPNALTVWSALLGRLLGALLFALAAFLPRRRSRRSRRLMAAGGAGVTAAVLLIAVFVRAFAGPLPLGLTATVPPGPSTLPDPRANSALVTLQLVMAVLYGLAAVGFLLRSRRLADEFFGWLAIAAVLAAASHVNYVMYPSQYSQWVYTGDGFRLAAYMVLLAGSMREIRSYWGALSDAAVLDERRRIARDLHDGLAQELAFLARNLAVLEGEADEDVLRRLRSAVERAQFESRQAINTLAAPSTQTFEAPLAEAAAAIAERFHLDLELDLITEVRLSSARAEALVRIACEAITNVARHSGASRVSLSLVRDGSRVRLRVSDAGRGFNTAAPGGGFGLISMRERARSIGGDLRISSAPGRGSQVEVAV
ncbi:MAG TPA: sensor histidine kinase [Streptosporangiaceae bacterium]|nr:sensor histidine kinase [Streptosporangiaceae bacterium]